MEIKDHTPSLAHLRDFVRSRNAGRPTHVAQDRKQVTAPAEDRFFAFAYEKFITGVIAYINNGSRGGAMAQAAAAASDRMRPSYEASAVGMGRLLPILNATAVRRRQRNVVAFSEDGVALVSLRVHLLIDLPDTTRLGVLMYFSEKPLTAAELAIVETAVALAVRDIDPQAIPAIIMVRTGGLRIIEEAALAPSRVDSLRDESLAYRDEWAASA